MVSLCLTNPHLNGVSLAKTLVGGHGDEARASVTVGHSEKQQSFSGSSASLFAAKDIAREEVNTSTKDVDALRKTTRDSQLNSEVKQVATRKNAVEQTVNSARSPAQVASDFDSVARRDEDDVVFDQNRSTFFNGILGERREKMLQALRTMGSPSQRHRGKAKASMHQYSQCVTDAKVDAYRVHKWRIKSGRTLNMEGQLRRKPRVRNRLAATVEHEETAQEKPFPKRRVRELPPVRRKSKQLRSNEVPSKRPSLSTVQEGKEKLFSFQKADTHRQTGQHGNTTMMDRLRQSMRHVPPLLGAPRRPNTITDDFGFSEFQASVPKLVPLYRGLSNRQSTGSVLLPTECTWQENNPLQQVPDAAFHGHGPIRLPPVAAKNQRRMTLPAREQSSIVEDAGMKKTLRFGARTHGNDAGDGEPALTKRKYALEKGDDISGRMANDSKFEGPLGQSPTHKKSNSSMTMFSSESTGRAGSKEGTPTDSEASLGAAMQKRLRKMKTSRSLLTKSDPKGSPQFFRHVKPGRMDALMWKWYVVARLTVWIGRLCKHHRMMADDSFNIKSGQDIAGDSIEGTSKREVLFDVTDYKLKNQLRLSDTTRRTLTLPSRRRTEKDINLVQAALRNIKAVSDHSAAVQKQIGRHGYFVGFDGKRVVVREGRKPHNYYILLAGSAVVIKEDEEGKTNPVLFMRRGDVFGEHEILEDINWEWSVVTVGYCEFLVLDRETYSRIFITGGGGGLFNDPDRGNFLRSISLLRQWPANLLNDNHNRCLFRYFKRGALLVKDDLNTEWIYVVKSGSCSVMKTLMVENLSDTKILKRMKTEQKFKPTIESSPRLVEEAEDVTAEGHLIALKEKEEDFKSKAQEASVYQQLEMSTVLKELNPDVIGLSVTSNANVDELDNRTEFPMSSLRTETKRTLNADVKRLQFEDDKELASTFLVENGANGYRLSRHSDRHPPRTPSPMKAAYLRTGPSPASRMSIRAADISNSFEEGRADVPVAPGLNSTSPKPNTNRLSPQKHVDVTNFLLSSTSPAIIVEPEKDTNLQPTHVNLRKLTKGEVFGIGSTLYPNQPRLSLVSNGGECLMLNKKFYLENATDECLHELRQTEFPYPNEEELIEQHWRLMSWQAYQAKIIEQVIERRNTMREHKRSTRPNPVL